MNTKLTSEHFVFVTICFADKAVSWAMPPSLLKSIWHYRQNSPFPQEQASWVALKFDELNSLSDVYGGPPAKISPEMLLEMFPDSRHSIVWWNTSVPKAQCILSPPAEQDQPLMEACTEYEDSLTIIQTLSSIVLHNSWGWYWEKFGRFFGVR